MMKYTRAYTISERRYNLFVSKADNFSISMDVFRKAVTVQEDQNFFFW